MKKILCLLLLPWFLFACAGNSGKTSAERIDHLLQESFKDNEFVGGVLVADQGKVIYKKSFGKADAASVLVNTDSTKFLIASLSKPITALLVLRLVDKGVVYLNQSIDHYFTVNDPVTAKISLHQLLTHTSGINEIINEEEEMDLKSLIQTAKVKFTPGAEFEYSNSGYVILKEIMQRVTGQTYAALLQAEVFGPAGMASSGVARNSMLGQLAKGYVDVAQTTPSIIKFPLENIDGAGTVYSTTGDLFRLDSLLYTTSILSDKMRALMLQQHVPEKYAYGWFVRERGGVWDDYYHQGNLPGFASFISRRVQKHHLVVLLSNAEKSKLSAIEKDIAKILKHAN